MNGGLFYKLIGDWTGDGVVSVLEHTVYDYWFGASSPVAPSHVDLDHEGQA